MDTEINTTDNSQSPSLQSAVCTEQVRQLYSGLPTSIAINFAAAIVLTFTQWGVVPATQIGIWLSLFILVTATRTLLNIWHRYKTSEIPDTKWRLYARLATGASGITWGLASVLMFPVADMPHQVFLAFVLAGMSAGAIAILAIDFVSLLAFVVPALAMLTAMLFLENTQIATAMGTMVFLFLFFTSFIAKRLFNYLIENVKLTIKHTQTELSLRAGEERLKQAQRVARLGSFEWVPRTGELKWSDQHFCLWGLEPGSVTPSYEVFKKGLHPDDVSRLEEVLHHTLNGGRFYDLKHRVRWPDGSVHHIHGRGEVTFGKNGEAILMNGTVLDITEQVRAEELIHKLAFYDPLTHLPNRRLLQDRLEQSVVLGKRKHRLGAVLFIDLDDFKSINDTKGHSVGDLLLIEIGKRIVHSIRQDDTVARIGGDEFVVILSDLDLDKKSAQAQTESIATKILAALSEPILLQGVSYHSSSSIGITLFGDEHIEADELLKRADIAMYQAKQSGRNAIRFFDPKTQAIMKERVNLDSDLRNALQENQFLLFYQPQVIKTGKVVGAEVLLRWRHPTRGLVSPLDFIPLAEESGLIIPIGNWVLDTVCKQLKEWERNTITRELNLSVNVSTRQFHQHDFVQQVKTILQRTGANPAKLKLELTESSVLDNIVDCIDKMQQLKQCMVGISMDDFGTGYSSLSYLSQLPLDELKIDQSFVRNIGINKTDTIIVQTITAMTKSLGLHVIAEGVETQAQHSFLADSGCFTYQGYLFGKPAPLDEFERSFINKNNLS